MFIDRVVAANRRTVWLTLFLILIPTFGRAAESPVQQDPAETRAEELRRLRLAKAAQLEEPVRPAVERALVWIEGSGRERVANLNYKRFFPKFGGLPTGGGFAFGTRYWNPRVKSSGWDLQGVAAATFKGYEVFELQAGNIDQPERDWSAFFDFGYRDAPEENFFGRGPGSLRGQRTDFRRQDASYGGVVRYRPRRWLRTELRGNFRQVEVGDGSNDDYADISTVFDEVTAPGLAEQPDFVSVTGSLIIDYRQTPGDPHAGGLFRLDLGLFDGLGGDDFDFSRIAADARHFLPLGVSSRVLAFRFHTSVDFADGESRVPFYYQNTLGGSEMLRGFREFRFRDENLVFMSAEYRWEAIPAFEFAAFYDAGRVFNRISDFGFNDLETSFGGGFRVKNRSGVIFRIDVGKSREGVRIYLKFGPSF